MDPDFCNIAKAMEYHFLKYFETIPHLYCFAFIIDPRIKFRGLQVTLNLLDEALNTSHSNTYSRVADEFFRVFCLYTAKFGRTCWERLRPPTSEYSHILKKSNLRWKKLMAKLSPSSISWGPPTPETIAQGDIDKYLHIDHRGGPEFADHDNVDLLLFWKNNQRIYPVLAQLAREILAVPVSTVSSEAAFSLEGRTVSDRRSGLAPDMVETTACLKDWDNAAAREQHSVVDADFANELAGLNLDSE
uniref:HAT C-terminal dimerisation domain-containing protein n=1 Tax=Arundo donax TaxID=35708 RepID=A0A0A8ZVE1_ARUDO